MSQATPAGAASAASHLRAAAAGRRLPTLLLIELFTAGSASTGMYRGIKLYEAAVQETGGKLGREDVAAALDHAKIPQGPGGGAEMVPGKMHCRMNMYVAVCRVEAGKPRYDVISRHDMVDPKEC